MKVVYHLSSRQRKELLVRGRAILVAVPVPPIEVANWKDWARTVFPEDLRPLIVWAGDEEIRVVPKAGPRATLTDLLGNIRGDAAGPSQWSVAMAVCVVKFSPPKPRGADLQLAWPSDVLADGVSVLPAAPP